MSLSSRGKSGPVISSQSPTAVLLVCIYDSLVVDITPELIRARFGKYAPISKVLIFERGEVTKLFLQLPTPQLATEAKTELDGSKLLESICKMSIYFSGLEKLEMREEQSSPTRTNFVSEYDLLTKSSPDSDSEGFNDLLMHSFTAFSPFARSKTDNPQQLAREILETQSKREQAAEESPFDFEIRSSIDSLLNSHSNSSASDQTPAQLPQKTGTVLAFETGRKVQIRHIYNLFSNFGNIAGISKKKAGAFVKFRSSQFASMAEAYLSGQWLLGSELKLRRTEQSDFLPKENEFCELVFFDSSFDRFTPHKSITVNAPSRTIHVSSLRKQLCKEQTLRNIFQQHGKVEALQLIRSSDRNMALVRFSTLQDSFSAVAQLHNALYSGRKMQISFTKSRI